jgi:hypothetical protein
MIATAHGPAAVELASLPPTVADYLRRLVARMNASNERVHAHLVARGVEAAELAAEREAPGMAKCRIELADFRLIAGKQGFDGPALIEAAAGEYGLGLFASFRQVSYVGAR